MKILNPANEHPIREVAEDRADSIRTKFEAARAAQKGWAQLPFEQRLSTLRKFREQLVARKEELARILSSEMGKPIAQARNEVGGVLGRVDFFLEKTGAELQDEVVLSDPSQGLEERISHEPLGVIANISAWNYPYFVGSNVFVPALLTGNAVLYKPSEFATLTGMAIADLLWQAGVPKDVFALVIGTGEAGAELLRQKLNGVFFTGSYPTGSRIAEAAARQLMKVQLELGGKDPVYVCDDVDVAAVAAAVADGAFYNTGQSCCSVERIYVHERIFEPFLKTFLETVAGFKVGDPMDEQTYIGPLTRGPQLAVLERQVADARAKGARVLCGGHRMPGPGYWFEPTVLIDVNHSMEVMREESFGPIIGIQKVRADEEALGLMNDTEYGLTAGVYTRDAARAKRLLSQLNAGSAYWNCCDRVSPRLPWSGRGHSGLGSTLSTYGIEAFTQPKAWHLRSVK